MINDKLLYKQITYTFTSGDTNTYVNLGVSAKAIITFYRLTPQATGYKYYSADALSSFSVILTPNNTIAVRNSNANQVGDSVVIWYIPA